MIHLNLILDRFIKLSFRIPDCHEIWYKELDRQKMELRIDGEAEVRIRSDLPHARFPLIRDKQQARERSSYYSIERFEEKIQGQLIKMHALVIRSTDSLETTGVNPNLYPIFGGQV